MKKNIIIGIVAVFMLTLVISTAMAFGPGYRRGMSGGPGYDSPPVSNLTAEQSSKIQAIQENNLKNITPLRDELFAKRTELRDLWCSQNPDQAQIKALQVAIQDINTQLQEKATNARLEMSKVLTTGTAGAIDSLWPRYGQWNRQNGRPHSLQITAE